MNTNILTRTSWNRVREIVRCNDEEICQYCGVHDPDGEVDHILPLSQGGRDSFDNLVWACQSCNRNKQGLTLAEWIGKVTVGYKRTIIRCQRLLVEHGIPLPDGTPIVTRGRRDNGRGKKSTSTRKPTRAEYCKVRLMAILGQQVHVPAAYIYQKMAEEGYSSTTVKRAKYSINDDTSTPYIVTGRMGRGWAWHLVPGNCETVEQTDGQESQEH